MLDTSISIYCLPEFLTLPYNLVSVNKLRWKDQFLSTFKFRSVLRVCLQVHLPQELFFKRHIIILERRQIGSRVPYGTKGDWDIRYSFAAYSRSRRYLAIQNRENESDLQAAVAKSPKKAFLFHYLLRET